jgi:hypothetical protein
MRARTTHDGCSHNWLSPLAITGGTSGQVALFGVPLTCPPAATAPRDGSHTGLAIIAIIAVAVSTASTSRSDARDVAAAHRCERHPRMHAA